MTIKEIARICGVSRGTVDRVVNGRGKVRPDTEQRILKVLSENSYQKNIAGRALTIRKASPMIGVLVSGEGNPFFNEVIEGMRGAEKELSDYGVSLDIRLARGYDVDRQLLMIDELFKCGMSALVLQPINDERVRLKIGEIADESIPVVTVNTDIENSRRSVYVGSDYRLGGETAAGLVGLATGGEARLGIIEGVSTLLGHVQRLHGFTKRLSERYPNVRITAAASGRDDDETSYITTREMLSEHPDIDSLMIIAAGTGGVCRAVRENGGSFRIVAFDATPQTAEMMRLGVIRAVVCQQPYQQGYRAVRAAFDLLLTGQPPQSDSIIMENQIKIVENL